MREKEAFIKELHGLLREIPKKERDEIIYDIKEHFHQGLSEGKTEEQVSVELGSPKLIAKELLVEYQSTQDNRKGFSLLRAIGLGFFNLIFILGPALAIFGVVLAGWVVAITFMVSPLAMLGSTLFLQYHEFSLTFFVSFILCGLGIFISLGMLKASKGLNNILQKYVNYNLRVIRGARA